MNGSKLHDVAADVLDSQWQDEDLRPYEKTVHFSLAGIPCRPAKVTLRSAPRFIYTVLIPAVNGRARSQWEFAACRGRPNTLVSPILATVSPDRLALERACGTFADRRRCASNTSLWGAVVVRARGSRPVHRRQCLPKA